MQIIQSGFKSPAKKLGDQPGFRIVIKLGNHP